MLPHVGATSGFLVLGGYALGCAAKAAQTADTGATGVTGVLSVRSTCVLNKISIFPPCCVLGKLLHLPVIVLLKRRLNRSDGEEQIAVARFSILCRNYRRLRDEQLVFFERPNVFADRVRAQPNCFTDFSVAWPALERLAILTEQQVGVDRDFRCAQTQRENLLR